MKARWITLGFSFALLWASASAATKIALLSAQPFVIAVSRFFIAGLIMLLFAHGIRKYRLPQKKEWKKLMCYGLLNVSIYLGLYIIAMQKISAGLGTLSVALNPVFISLMAAFIFKQPVGIKNSISLLICLAGVFIAAYPLLQTSYASVDGIIIILISMLAYSAGAIYFSKAQWNGLDIITINGWQTIFGGIFLLPLLFFTYKEEWNHYDFNFWSGTLWLAIPVSIGAVQCWLYLSQKNAASASYWLFLCPVFGFIISAVLLKEPLSWYTAAGVLLVLIGLYARNEKKKNRVATIND
ncbi:MAG: EamA family transporter [Rhizobacter sp.]|nr:EamA family transporter [Ferruginibacter sp.]